MSNIDKRALREAAVRAGGVKWQYMRATQHTKAYLTDEKGWTVVNCTDGDVPAKCAGFIESANPATVLALLDELEAADKRIAELPGQKHLIGWRMADYTDETADPTLAKNWATAVDVLPIFEGDVNTKLSAAAAGKGE
ncbi:ead/Ea22-like family protein [Enterobacter hormaechei]|nr:ead/Ea22-like family protein [Enterobacter hormaechei]